MLNAKEAAAALNGGEYGQEGSPALFADMRAAGLVAVFGASDDLIELRGAIHEEVGAYDGGTALVTSEGLYTAKCDNDDCPHEAFERRSATAINAIWDRDGYSWVYETTIPHETFEIKEDGEPYCRGIVFALADVPDA